jgi:hypothetical protein
MERAQRDVLVGLGVILLVWLVGLPAILIMPSGLVDYVPPAISIVGAAVLAIIWRRVAQLRALPRSTFWIGIGVIGFFLVAGVLGLIGALAGR